MNFLSLCHPSEITLAFNCAIAIDQLKKQSGYQPERKANRTLLDTINLISTWKSEGSQINVTDDQQQHEEIFNFQALPASEQELIHQIKRNESLLVPFGVYMEVRNIDGLQDNDIVSMFVALIYSKYGRIEIKEYFIETLSGIIYPLTRMFEAGVEPLHLDNPSPGQQQPQLDHNASPLQQQLCIVCQTHPVTRTILPCKHACLCKICYFRIKDDICPICRSPILSFFVLRDESFLPRTEDEERDDISRDIRRMGWWEFVKAVWNAG